MRRNVRMMSLALILAMLLTLTACGGKTEQAAAPAETQAAASAAITGVEDGILTVGMECAYAP